MKKFLFLAIAAAAMTSCSQDEVLEVAQKQAISFGNAFVGNSTRAAIDNTYSGITGLTEFNVYGTVTGTGTAYIFKGDKVTGKIGDAKWSCDNVQYWIPEATYNFMAIADAESVSPSDGLPTTITYKDGTTTADAVQKDLLLAELNTDGIRTVTTDETATPTENPVEFTFSHLLSKAKFTFTHSAYQNATGTTYTFDVKNIRFVNVKKGGTYTIATKNWEATGTGSDLLFGNLEAPIAVDALTKESANERVFVPVEYTATAPLTAKFTVETLINNTVVTSKNYTATIQCDFEAGKAYNFNVSLSNSKIEFTVESVNGWGDKIDVTTTTTPATITVTPDEEQSAQGGDQNMGGIGE